MQYYAPKLIDPNLKTNNPDLRMLTFRRNYLDDIDYQNTLENFNTNNNNYDYIKIRIFEDTKSCLEQIATDSSGINIIVSTNSFEYCKPKGMTQYLIWVKDHKMDHNEVIKYIDKYIRNRNYIIWTNENSNYGSLRQIKHFHLMTSNILPAMTLKKVIIIARHGPRTPLFVLPKLDQTCWANYYPGELTYAGKLYCDDFGKYIAKLYEGFFTFVPEKTIIKTTDSERTIVSARSFIRGLLNIDLSTSIIDRGRNSIDFRELKHLSQFIKLDFQSEILKYVSETDVKLLNQKIYELFGVIITNPEHYYDVNSTLKCYEYQNKNLIPKEWTQKDAKLLYRLSLYYYYKLYCDKYVTGKCTDNILEFVLQITKDPNINFAYISSHDTFVFPCAMRLANKLVRLPEFCSAIRYEIWDRKIRIYYDDQLIHD